MKPTRKCVLVADSARARLFTYDELEGAAEGEIMEGAELIERQDLVDPARRHRDSEIFTDTRPGLRQSQMGGPRHGVDDHRGAERREEARGFAAEIVTLLAAVSASLGRCPVVIVSSPSMLGSLRAALEAGPAWLRPLAATQFGRDLTGLRRAQIHDWLTAAGVLPPRARAGLEDEARQ